MSKKELIQFLTEILGPLPQIILRHIDILVTQGLTYKDIARAVAYIYVVQKQPIKDLDKWGIKGLVPVYLDKANNYYNEIKRQQESQRNQVNAASAVEVREVDTLKRTKRRKEGIDINEL